VELNASAVVRGIGDLFFRNLSLKLLALGLAAILFVLTRDEVTRPFDVPLKVVEDPTRVLMTDLPPTVQVSVRGPWTRVNRLTDYDLGVATVDLEKAEPGPLEIDGGAIVMPPGVVLAGIHYDRVDLRFDPVVERPVAVVASVVGQPAADYRLVRTEVEPAQWSVRGGRSQVQTVTQLLTEPFDISGARGTIARAVQVAAPTEQVELVGPETDAVRVEVRAVIEPVTERREIQVPIAVPDGLDPTGAIPRSYTVLLSGPLPTFRLLDALGLPFPIEAEVVPLPIKSADGGKVVEVRFRWSQSIAPEIRADLSFDRALERVDVPPPPPPPEGTGAPL
jgi:YbbR domain-containing protein